MTLKLGKLLNRSYNLRVPFLDGFYNISIFYNKNSSFILFSIDPDFSSSNKNQSVKVNMFKNIESSKFCESFLNLHTFKNDNLDILNQFHEIKLEASSDIFFVFNESNILEKTKLTDREVFDTITVYGFTIVSYTNEFLYLLAERQNIRPEMGKKIVRTAGMQIATNNAIEMMNTFAKELKNHEELKESKENQDKCVDFQVHINTSKNKG